MKDKVMTSIVLYGSIDKIGHEIWDWYQYFLKFNEKLGYPSTHFGILGESFKSGKITTIKRTEKRFRTALENGEYVEGVSIYSLPEEFTQAAFDYNTFMAVEASLEPQFAMVTVPSVDFDKVDTCELIKELGKVIKSSEGEIFEMSVYDSPYFYAAKANEASDYSSLKIIERLVFPSE